MRKLRGAVLMAIVAAVAVMSMAASRAAPGAAVAARPQPAASPDSAPAPAEDDQAEPSRPRCNCFGYFSCPATGKAFGYGQVSCGDPLWGEARAACEAACSPRCVDAGWTCDDG